jgi:hypothetical protein
LTLHCCPCQNNRPARLKITTNARYLLPIRLIVPPHQSHS